MAYTAWSVVFGEQPTAAKWNQLGANDAGFKDGTNIDPAAINYNHLSQDTSWDWSNWTPTITVGSPLTISSVVINVARYKKIGKTVSFIVDASFTLGGSAGNSIFMTLPVNNNLVTNNQPIGAGFIDGVTAWVQMNSVATQAIIRRYDNTSNITTGAGKVMRLFGTYEAA